jgi:selenocysteine lyase/cysteine desulfurase
MNYLTKYWADPLLEDPRVRLMTSLTPGKSCGIGVVDIDGIDPGAIGRYVWDTHQIIITPIGHPEFRGNRVTPNVYTTLEELDRFVDAMQGILKNGLPAKYLES